MTPIVQEAMATLEVVINEHLERLADKEQIKKPVSWMRQEVFKRDVMSMLGSAPDGITQSFVFTLRYCTTQLVEIRMWTLTKNKQIVEVGFIERSLI